MGPIRRASLILPLAVAAATYAQAPGSRDDSANEWPAYGRDAGGSRFSPLTQISRENVAGLTVAWQYRTGETEARFATRNETSLEVTPIVVAGTLYLSTPIGRVIALDPVSGAERWVFDPQIDRTIRYGDFTNRGVAAWLNPAAGADAPCQRRIFVAPAHRARCARRETLQRVRPERHRCAQARAAGRTVRTSGVRSDVAARGRRRRRDYGVGDRGQQPAGAGER